MAAKNGLLLNNIYTKAIKGFAATIPPGRFKSVESDNRVNYIEPDLKVFALKPPPNGPPNGGGSNGGNNQPPQFIPTGVRRIGANSPTSTAKINGIEDPMDVDIAIIDTGLDTAHPDLNVFKHVRCSGTGKNIDQHGHGSHVGGIAAAKDNGIGVVGVAPGARLWGVKVLDASPTWRPGNRRCCGLCRSCRAAVPWSRPWRAGSGPCAAPRRGSALPWSAAALPCGCRSC